MLAELTADERGALPGTSASYVGWGGFVWHGRTAEPGGA